MSKFIKLIKSERRLTTKKDRYGHWYGPFNNMRDFEINGISDLDYDNPKNPETNEYDKVEMSWLDASKNESRVKQHLKQVFELLNIPDVETALQKVKIEKNEYFYEVYLYFIPNGKIDLNYSDIENSKIGKDAEKIMQLQHLRFYLTDNDFMNFIETHNLTDFYNSHKEEIDSKGVGGR